MVLDKNGFNQAEYWKLRISGNIDLDVVGHRSLGKGYNEYLYRRRLEVLDDIIINAGKQIKELHVLEIGCGSGFYVNYWQSIGVKNLIGIDISPASIFMMQELYPDYLFYVIDASLPNAFSDIDLKFDIVTIFDVIYHVTDDNKATELIYNAANVLNQAGSIILTDCLGSFNYSIAKHVRNRSWDFYLNSLNKINLSVLMVKNLFNLLHPPLIRNKIIDYIIAGVYVLIGSVFKLHDSIGRFFGNLIYKLDARLFMLNIQLPNQAMIVIGKDKADDTLLNQLKHKLLYNK